MPQTIKDADGNDIEVFTADELAEKEIVAKEAAVEEFKKENPDKSDEITELQGKLDKVNEDLDKAGEKDQNFDNLRKQKDDAETKLKAATEGIDEKIGTAKEEIKKEVLEGVMQDHYADTLKSLAGDDEELKKKIEFNYNRLQDPGVTKPEVTKKLTDAYHLSTITETEDALTTSVISSGGVSRVKTTPDDKSFSGEEKELGQKFGISEDDIKKYGNK